MKLLVAGYSQEDTRRLSAELRAAGHQVLGAVGRHGARTFVKVVTPDLVVVPASELAAVRDWLADLAGPLTWVTVAAGDDAVAAVGRATMAARQTDAVTFEPPVAARPPTSPSTRPGVRPDAGAAPFSYFEVDANASWPSPRDPDDRENASLARPGEAGGAGRREADAGRSGVRRPAPTAPEPAPTRPATPRSGAAVRAVVADAAAGPRAGGALDAEPGALVRAARGAAPVRSQEEPLPVSVALENARAAAGSPIAGLATEPPPLPGRGGPTQRAARPPTAPARGATTAPALGAEPSPPQDADLVSKLAQTRFGDYHSLLEIEPEASPYAVREQYTRLSRLYSPRGWPRKLGPEDLEVLQEVASGLRDAYLILGDPELRARYERALLGASGSTPSRRS